ncbi:MAG: flagellar hook-basal body complex protein [Planctomycetes bacterium]|nr:flagellar hook-basal body complex protein [Planctomycetota bacterium]
MASTTALFTGLSGLAVNARRLDVIGNNIANINTVAFKSNRLLLAPSFSRNFSLGSAPSAQTGGTNPGQIGLGAVTAGTQRNFNDGAISATGVATDVAIEGDGFFIVDFSGEQLYTRAGAFQLNSNNDLVTVSGAMVQGFAVDPQFNIITGTLQDINIPLGTLTLAEASRNVNFNGNLNSSGVVATSGSTLESRAFFKDDALTLGMEMDGTELLTVIGENLYIDDGAGGSFLAIEGGRQATLTITAVEKGGKDLGTHTFGFMTAAQAAANGITEFGSTMNSFLAFMDQVFGLDATVISGQNLGGGITVGPGGGPDAGKVMITGNEGTVQDLDIDTGDIQVTYADPMGVGINQPFVMTKTAAANGESVRTSFVVFDSLGTALTVDLSFVLQTTTPGAGSTWEFIAESSDTDAVDRIIGLGVVNFDANGRFVSATNQQFSLGRDNGAVSPLTVNMNFDTGTDAISALTSEVSILSAVFQDGSSIGTLSQFSIGDDGVISGSFDNGLTRDIGQIAMAKFSNNAGLVDAGNNLFQVGPNSGTALITSPLQFGTGRLIGAALELSNVDLSQEFINMILTSTGYTASSRVITVTDELIDELLRLVR